MISRAELILALNYDKETGVFTWSNVKRGAKVGDVAGFFNNHGYRQICIKKKFYLAHRLAWLYSYGETPSGSVDHINGDRSDNRLSNLRICSVSENAQNQKTAGKRNKLGLLGVCFDKKAGKYRASICINSKRTHIGYFETAEAASEAYLKEKSKKHPFYAVD